MHEEDPFFLCPPPWTLEVGDLVRPSLGRGRVFKIDFFQVRGGKHGAWCLVQDRVAPEWQWFELGNLRAEPKRSSR